MNAIDNLFYDAFDIDVNDDEDDNELTVNNFLKSFHLQKSEYIDIDNFNNANLSNSNNMIVIASYNIRSMRQNFENFLINYHGSRFFDVTALCETRVGENFKSFFKIPGHTILNQCRDTHGGGVALIVNDRLMPVHIPECSFTTAYLECISAEIGNKNDKSFITSIYRPPSGDVSLFLRHLEEILTFIRQRKYRNFYVMGDFNIDMLSDTRNMSMLKRLMSSYFGYCLTSRPTRVTCETSSLIDHIWSSNLSCNIKNFILLDDNTDHFPIVSCFSNSTYYVKEPQIYRSRKFTVHSQQAFLNEISVQSWNDVYVTIENI